MKAQWLALAILGATLLWAPAGQAAPLFASSGDAGFDAWRTAFAERAIADGRSPAVVERLLAGLTPDPSVVELDQNQPEFVRPPWEYIESTVSAARIAEGARLRAAEQATFAAVQARYGVDGDVLAGIWGVETNFGTYPLRYEAARSIATLAYEGRRRWQFEGFLLALLEMVEKGGLGPGELKSSWAGAMGQPQFMPDVYLRYAADFSGDGRRDIWNDRGDVLASIANYLKEKGWVSGGPVLEEVRLPAGFDLSLADEIARPMSFWAALGAVPIGGGGFSPEQAGVFAELWLPAGKDGPALLLFPNFQVIKSYNPSDRYALAVALLARGFKGRPLLQATWPKETGYLARAEVLELQQRLALLGHPSGEPDGMFGANTRRAIRSFQLQKGLPADGYPTPALLVSVRTASGVSTPGAPVTETAADDTPRTLKARPTRSRLLAYAEVKTLQRLLGRLGYRIGKIDGDPGAQTRKAVRELEQRLGYRPTGRVDAFILGQARRLAAR